jgi:transcriptional regulator with XRE-family HTH domain
MNHPKVPRTAGGSRLHALRERCGKTQLEVELDASLGIGYLQRLELGKVHQPERETLERILTALNASFAECCQVMEHFGYTATLTLPDVLDTEQAIELFQGEMKHDVVPAYLLDCSHRLLTWNGFIPKLFGSFEADILIPQLIFGEAAESVLNAELFFPTQVRIIQYERQRYRDGVWYNNFINQMREYKTFDHYWRREEAIQTNFSVRPVAHLQFDLGRTVGRFRLISETLVHDPRFRTIYYLPADAATMQHCLAWQN